MATAKVISGSPAWHADRALGIGGSECGSLFNAGWGCIRRLVMEKRGMEPDYKHTPREEALFERGNELEDIIADKFARETGLTVRRWPSKVSKTHPHARVNMDRQIVAVDDAYLLAITADPHTGQSPLDALADEGFGPGVLEAKSMNVYDWKRLQQEGFEKHEHYILQLQHALAVTGYKWGAFAFLEPMWWEFKWFVVLRNEALCAEILRRVEAAWATIENPEAVLPQPLEAGDKRCRGCLYRRSCRGEAYLAEHAGADFDTDYVTVSDGVLVELATDLKEASEAAERASEVEQAIRARVKEELAARGLSKVEIPNVLKLAHVPVKGREGWDSKALAGEVAALKKDGLVQIAQRIEHCKKVGAPSTQFRVIPV